MRYFILFSLAILSITIFSYLFIYNDIGREDTSLRIIKEIIPANIKTKLKETIFVFKNQKILKETNNKLLTENTKLNQENLSLKKDVDIATMKIQELGFMDNEIKDLKDFINNQISYKSIQNHIIKEIGNINFNKIKEETISFYENNFSLKKYHINNIITFGKNTAKASAYIDYYDDRIFIVTATGIVSSVYFDDIKNDFFSSSIIDSNLFQFVDYNEFFKKSQFGIKDILIEDNKIYLSLTYALEENCFNTAIIYAEINYEYLNFNDFFIPNKCVRTENSYGEFNAHHASGRMVSYDKESILFAMGEYRFRDLAQEKNSLFGKIIKINKFDKSYKIISMGHRNNQGLLYHKESDTIFMTEHGPNGGDEININNNPNKELKNYGWPISSYGEHYGFSQRDDKETKYIKAPLYKSHSEYGFEEPFYYFTPSIGISEIINIPNKFLDIEGFQLLVSSLGLGTGRTLFHFVINENYEIIAKDHFVINERVRDMKYVSDKNIILLFLENTGSLAILEKK
ncbi:PQQ-dependent sugar dehydrogenase [Pelagibacteraceae bacterium]|nr:PQQ-dependent sugar dehydrogenase [Pelagibacteraceae bacterium]